jgi:hypothetical protein
MVPIGLVVLRGLSRTAFLPAITSSPSTFHELTIAQGHWLEMEDHHQAVTWTKLIITR